MNKALALLIIVICGQSFVDIVEARSHKQCTARVASIMNVGNGDTCRSCPLLAKHMKKQIASR